VTAAGLAAFACATLTVLTASELVALVTGAIRLGLPASARAGMALVESVVRTGREGREPVGAERTRLLAAGAVAALVGGTFLAGPPIGMAAGLVAPWAIRRLLQARGARYRRAVDGGGAMVALALADGLAAGSSLRGALAEAARSVDGPAGLELRRTAAELTAGARTDAALEALRTRCGSAALGAVVAACLVQRGVGGDLARLLREQAEALGDRERLADEVRAATAQARFTGLVVVLLPLGGAVLAELASPGFLAGLAGSLLTAWLVGLALGLQALAAVLIRRLGRVRW
jgi:tight adherence protein B